MARRKSSTLARRYGHSMSGGAAARVKRFVVENPEATAAALGGTVGTIFAGAPVAVAAIVGATTGVIGQKLVKACREGAE
jgi:hypothetical protein